MSNLSRAHEVEQQFHHLNQAGAYAEALELVTRQAGVFPAYAQKVVYSWRMTMACHLNQKNLALQILNEAVQAGCWYDGLETDPDYQILYGDSEFERLAKICAQRRAQAMADAVPVVKTLHPDPSFSPYPLLLALHGNNSSVETQVKHWELAVQRGWLLALPQSSQLFAPDTYTWNDWDWAQQEVSERYATLRKAYPIDPGRVVLAGFSMGAGLALWLVLSGAIQAQGLILVGPFLQDINSIVPFLEQHVPRGLRVYLVAGQRDQYCLEIAQQLGTLLPKYGIVCKLDEYPDLEHNFPLDFEKKLPQALSFVLSA